MKVWSFVRLLRAFSFVLFAASSANAQQTDIHGPAGSGLFGSSATVLPNGNFVVTDPSFSSGGTAVYLYSSQGTLISTLTYSRGRAVVTVLVNGNFVVSNPQWNNNGVVQVGAVTWGSATTGVSGDVSESNSIVGTSVGDKVGENITALANGNYVISSPGWNGSLGAATWCNGSTGSHGHVTSSNSLVGTSVNDQVASDGVVALRNGNYVVMSSTWNSGVGAASWGNGSTGTAGVVSSTNSLVGSRSGSSVKALENGNYVVGSPGWNGGMGAATWASGSGGTVGAISAINSLVGMNSTDHVGSNLFSLTNGNYVVASSAWNNNAGAVTWASGSAGLIGVVSGVNSLVGSSSGDYVGSAWGNANATGVTVLTNGNYVVSSFNWNANYGAATWGNGQGGTTGAISASNSLVGTKTGDDVAYGGVTALSDGNYVVCSTNGSLGAATWGDGAGGTTGTLAASNSLVGSVTDDEVGMVGVTALDHGMYVVNSSLHDNSGAATWVMSGISIIGPISPVNSLLGGGVGYGSGTNGNGVFRLSDGNFVIQSPFWNSGLGAVTWASGQNGIAGSVSSINSLIGGTGNNNLGSGGITPVARGGYVVFSPQYADGTHVGAITFQRGKRTPDATLNASNSVFGGGASNSGSSMVFGYDSLHDQLVVGRPTENIVTLFKPDELFGNGFE